MSIIDSSPKPKNIVLNNGASISTNKSRFGGGSLYISGRSDYAPNGGSPYAYVASNTDFGFGTGDFTVEMWVYPLDCINWRTLISIGRYDDGLLWRMGTGGDQLYINGNYWTWGASSVPSNTWSHLALIRNGGTVKVYINGTESFSTSGGVAASNLGSSREVYIGTGMHSYGSETFNGYMDEIRITKGIGSARYLGNFSVNSILAPFPSSGTPITPANVVTDLLALAGNQNITITWTPPAEDNGGIITDYSVQYSTDRGSTWNDFVHTASDSNISNITDLTNDIEYLVRIAPINIAGTGNYVVTQSPLIPTLPLEDTTADPYYYNTSLLLHLNGTNNSTTITDNSRFVRSCSAVGDTKITTLKSKFGGSSAYFDGSGDYITVPNSAGLDFGSDDFTIEYWEYRTDDSGGRPVMSRVNTDQGYNPFLIGYASGSNVYAYFCQESNYDNNNPNYNNWNIANALNMGNFILNSWIHYAVVRQGNTIRTYQNGVQIATANSSGTIAYGNGPLNIGRYNNSTYYQGYLDDIRITKGVCRYPDGTTFSIRTLPFSNLGAEPTSPNAPISLTAYPGDTISQISFTPPSFEGYSPLLSYGLEISENADPRSWNSIDSTTKLLLHFDKNDIKDDDTLKDFSIYNRNILFNRNNSSPAYIAIPFNGYDNYSYYGNYGNIVPQKFGNGCLQTIPGYNPPYIIKAQESSDLNPGTGDYTLEMFLQVNPNCSYGCSYSNGIGRLFGSNNASVGSYFGIWAVGNYGYNIRLGKVVGASPQAYYVDLGHTDLVNMKHLAFSRKNGIMRIFLDGVKIKETADTDNDIFSAGGLVIMGGDSGSHYANNYVYGKMDELRYTVGESLYDASFDLLPQSAFKNGRMIGLNNNTSYVFRMRSQNSFGYGDYSSESNPITVSPPPNIIISQQPKNDRVVIWNENGSFSIVATVEDGSNPTYQWQKLLMIDYYGNKTWTNIDGATSSSLSINSFAFQASDYSSIGMDSVRCILSSPYESKLSKSARLVNIFYTKSNINIDNYYNNQYNGNTNYNGNWYDIYNLQANGTFYLNLNNYSYFGGSYDTSWYTGNDTRFQLQSWNGSSWVDTSIYFDRKANGALNESTQFTAEDSLGSVYYRWLIKDLWPYTTNNGTESNTESAYSMVGNYFRIDYSPSAPGAPSNVVADPGDTLAIVSWNAPTITGGSTTTSYTVQYSSNGGSSWTTFGTSANTSLMITGLTNGTNYSFRVAASNSAGTGSYSDPSSSISPNISYATIPDAPISVSGVACNTKAYLSWVAPTGIGKSLITGYNIQYSTDNGDTWNNYIDLTPTPTPSPTPTPTPITDPYFNNVSLLLHMDGANGSTTFTDSSSNALSVTANGNAQISTSQSKFGGASVYLDGGGTLTFSGQGFTGIAAGEDFTWEAWLYPTDLSRFITVFTGTDGQRAAIFFWHDDFGYIGQDGAGAKDVGTYGQHLIALNQWFHGAVTRQNGELRVFVNGVMVASGSGNTDALWAGGATLSINGSQYYSGYIDDLRITKGVARYTANFTPPTAAFADSPTPTPNTDPYFSNVSLLLHMDGANGSTTFTDSSVNALTVTANGNAQISTAESKFGGASGSLINTGDYLTIPTTPDFEFATGDFTVETWVRLQSLTDCVLVSLGDGAVGGGTYTGWVIRYLLSYGNHQNALLFYRYDGIETLVWSNNNVPISAQNWHHVAVSRASGTLRFFVDGTQVGTASSVTSYNGVNNDPLYIGRAFYGGGPVYFNGYIDDLRITKGVARYTENFTP